jgi:hypothetical protein
MVEDLYDGEHESDGFVFNEPTQKVDALIAIVKLT